jgi:hypothetical protein
LQHFRTLGLLCGEKEEEQRKNAINSGHFVLIATHKGSSRNSLGPISLFSFKWLSINNISHEGGEVHEKQTISHKQLTAFRVRGGRGLYENMIGIVGILALKIKKRAITC